MNTPPWLQQQQYKPGHPSIFQSVTPPPPGRPRSAAAANSPPRGRHVIPRSHSVLHARPPSAPRISAASPSLLDQHQQPSIGGGLWQGTGSTHALVQPQQGGVGIGSPVHVDYSAIQRIADGVERMVRSWTSENSCRAQVYAKAYDSLHAAAARGKDQAASQQHQHHPPQQPLTSSSACTEPSPFKPTDISAHLLPVRNLQSPADPDIMPNTLDRQHRVDDNNLINDEEVTSSAHQQVPEISSLNGGQTSYAGDTGNCNVTNFSTGAPYATTRLTTRNGSIVENGEIFYTEGPPYPMGNDGVKKLKTGNNMCVHNRTHNYPSGLGLINEDDDTEQKNAGSIPVLAHHSHNQLDNMRAEYDPRELARIQHIRSQQGDLVESGVTLHLQQPYQKSNHPLIRNDLINSNSLIKSTFRSRSPSIRLGTWSNTNASNSLEVYHESSKHIEKKVDEKYEAKVKELEISLLECATEYEVQLVEMKMKMLQMKSAFRQKRAPEENKLALCKPLQIFQDTLNNSRISRQANASPEVPIIQSLEQPSSKRRTHKEKYSENASPIKPKSRFLDMYCVMFRSYDYEK